MNLAEIFGKIAYKRLARVDIPNAGSNQHELNGISALKDFFGTQATIKRMSNGIVSVMKPSPNVQTDSSHFMMLVRKAPHAPDALNGGSIIQATFSLFLLPTTFLCLQQAGQMNGSMLLSSATIPHGIGRLCNFSKS